MNSPLVTVWCVCYNHEKTIGGCLDSMIRQRTSFPFEILVHDDASTDHSAAIISEYQKNYPELIRPILQKENQCSRGIHIGSNFIYPRTRGKYIAHCEGDDRWCDDLKLQKQTTWMEQHPECTLCAHGTVRKNMYTGKEMPFCSTAPLQSCFLSPEQIADNTDLFHTSSFMQRREFYTGHLAFIQKWCCYDYAVKTLHAVMGKIGYLPEMMSLYRQGTEGSWTEMMQQADYREAYCQRAMNTLDAIDDYSGRSYHRVLAHEKETLKALLQGWGKDAGEGTRAF